MNRFCLHLNRVSLIYSNALSFRSGDIFFFSSRVNLMFLQAPGHTNAHCQCSIDASARRLTRGVCTRVHIGAVHFYTAGNQASHAVGWKKETDMATSAKETVQLLLKAPPYFSSANYSSIQFIPSKAHRLYIFGIKWKFPNPLHPKTPWKFIYFNHKMEASKQFLNFY